MEDKLGTGLRAIAGTGLVSAALTTNSLSFIELFTGSLLCLASIIYAIRGNA